MSGAMMALLGSGAPTPKLSNRTVSANDAQISPSDANSSASYDLLSTGVAQSTVSPGGTTSYAPEWLPGAVGSQWEVRFTVNSGAPSGTFGSWLALSSNRGFSISASRNGGSVGVTTNSAQVLVEIRSASSGTVVASATVDISATAEVSL